jgi:hypothetical protein
MPAGSRVVGLYCALPYGDVMKGQTLRMWPSEEHARDDALEVLGAIRGEPMPKCSNHPFVSVVRFELEDFEECGEFTWNPYGYADDRGYHPGRWDESEYLWPEDVVAVEAGARRSYDADGRPVVDLATCGTCGRTWDDALVTSVTPAPSGRCPFEYEHGEED